VMTSTRPVLISTRPILMSTRPILMSTRSVLMSTRSVLMSTRSVLTNTGKMSVKKTSKTPKIELFAQNKPVDAKPIPPAHPGTGIGRVIAAMTGRRSAPSLPENAAPTGLCSSPIGWERARVRVDKVESQKYHQNHDKNRTAPCGRISMVGNHARVTFHRTFAGGDFYR